MRSPKIVGTDEALLSRLSAIFEQKSDRLIRTIEVSETPSIVVVGLPGSGRSHAMHLVAETCDHYELHDLDHLPILAQVSGLDIEPKNPMQRSIIKTRVSANAYLRLIPFSRNLLIDDTYLWLDANDLADVFPTKKYSNDFRSYLYERFGGWPAGIAAVASRIARGDKAVEQTIEDAADDLSARYFAKFVYGLHDGLIDDLLFFVAAEGCTRQGIIANGFAERIESIERLQLKGLVDTIGPSEQIALPRPVIAASRHHSGRLLALGLELAGCLHRNGDGIQSAMVLQNVGATLAALSVLQKEIELPRLVLSNEIAETVCLRLDEAFIVHDAFLWLSVYMYRSRLVSTVQLLDEVENMITATGEEAEKISSLREILLLVRDLHYGESKQSEYDESKIREIVEHWRSTPFSVIVAFLAGSHCAVNRHFDEAQDYFTLAESLSNREANVVTYGNAHLLRLLRAGDDLHREKELAKSVFALTKFGTSPSAKNVSYFEVAISAWLLGDAELFEAAIEQLIRIEGTRFLAPYREFARAVRGLAYDDQCGSAYLQAWTALFATLLPFRAQADPILLKRAYDLSRVSGSAFLQGVAGMVYARTLSGEARGHLLESMVLIAEGIGHKNLAMRAKALIAGEDLESELHTGWLKRYVADVASESHTTPRLALFEGTALIGGESISLGEKTHMLLTLLSVRSGSVSSEFLMSAIWPDASHESARNALKMCVRRARNVLRSDRVIVKTHLGYELDPTLRSDLSDIAGWLELTSASEISSSIIERGAESLLVLLKGLPIELQQYEAFDDIRPMLTNLEQDITSRLRELLSHHPCSARTRDLIRQISQYSEETAEELRVLLESYALATP